MTRIPASAAVLLAFIREVETGRADRIAYDVVYGHNKTAKPVTQMTVDEVIQAGPRWTRVHGSSASGAYQFMRATLRDLKKQVRLTGMEVMEPGLQDVLAFHLLKRRGFDDWVAGAINDTSFGNSLSMEWASLPVLSSRQGAHRRVSRGETYYAGDLLNKALTPPERVEDVLQDARMAGHQPPPKGDDPMRDDGPVRQEPGSYGPWNFVMVVLIAAALGAAWYFGLLDKLFG